jgi:hypothetical protein
VASEKPTPLLPFTSTSGCCGAARQTGLSCILQHFCWLKRRCADKPDLCSCSDGSRSIPSQLPQYLFDGAANFTEADVRKCTLEKISN